MNTEIAERPSNPFLLAIYAAGGSPQASSAGVRKLTPDTVSDARVKAKALIAENRDWFRWGEKEPASKPTSLLYKREGKLYTLHLKYANRKLKGWCEAWDATDECEAGGFDEYEEVPHEYMLQMFDSLVWSIDNGECDAALQAVIDDIARMRKSKTA